MTSFHLQQFPDKHKWLVKIKLQRCCLINWRYLVSNQAKGLQSSTAHSWNPRSSLLLPARPFMARGTSSPIYLKYLWMHVADDGFGSGLQNSWRNVGRARTKHLSVRHGQRAKQSLRRWDGEGRHVSSSQSSREVELTLAERGLLGGGGPPFGPPPVSFEAQTRSQHTRQTPSAHFDVNH